MSWYYEFDRQQRGPVSEQEFAGLVQAGTIRPETLVWRQGWPEWKPYSQTGEAASVGATGSVDTAVCAVSGRTLPKSEMLEYEGRWVSVEHKDEFFQRLREGVSLPTDMVYASFGRRFAAKFIDGLILWVINMGVGFVAGLAMAAIIAGQGAENVGLGIALQVFLQLFGMAVGILYSIYFIRKQDATPGKRILGLKVLRADGSSLSKGRIVGRYFSEIVSSMILMIGYLMAAFDAEQRRALHDRMCDTRVFDVR